MERHGVVRPDDRAAGRWPWIMAFIRLPMILVGIVVVVAVYRWSGVPVGFEAASLWVTLNVSVANVACLALLLWRFRVEGISVRELIGYRRNTVGRDVLSGFGLSVVLAVPFTVALGATLVAVMVLAPVPEVWAMFQLDIDYAIEPPLWLIPIALVVFPLLNAPVEELQYRGYVQAGLIAKTGSTSMGVLLAAFGFAVHHIAFALTWRTVPVFVVAFTVWGAAAGYAVLRMKRLFPVIVAHYIVNLMTGASPLVYLLAGTESGG